MNIKENLIQNIKRELTLSKLNLKEKISNIKKEVEELLDKRNELKEVVEIQLEFLGKKGRLTNILKGLKGLDKDVQKEVGALANTTKNTLIKIFENKKKELETAIYNEKIKSQTIDISIKGRPVALGNKHPLTKTIEDITKIFTSMGFQTAEGPELEHEYYNFETLNLPKDHPARDEQDSFYITKEKLLRTQTSPVQIRVMEKMRPPISIISSGRCFRRDATDATHSHTFHQIEGLLVDKDVSFADLKGTLHLFARKLFGSNTKLRFRPDYFPFTEPSAEFAISCFGCAGSSSGTKGCKVCKGSGWLEMGGCGLVDPDVFGFVNIDPLEYSGYAFGMGIERIAMVKHGVPDIRMFYENDYRFLNQF